MTFRLLSAAILFASSISAQNINTTFRYKMSFPGQTLANVWGYVAGGKEYALVGGSQGLIIIDITNPTAPQQIVQIPGPNNLWKEIKTYQNYAYVVSEGGQGIQIVNLTNLPSSTLPSKFYKGDGAISNQLNKIHALHIDETKGFLYAWGGDLFGGAAKIFDLRPDPWNPKYVGKFDQLGYIHDGYVDNDTMYSGHIYDGQFAIVNMASKSAPELINTQTTPGAFVHNTWLCDDRRTLLATDEVNNSFLSTWDVSDPTDIKFLDKIQSNPGSGSMVHNTYAHRNWAVTSWYKDGFTIVDITRPDNLVQVGNYDTFGASGGGSEGCWGVYPYFPSGNIIASNISPGDLFIIAPNYVRACYLEGNVTHGLTGNPLANAQMQVVGSNPLLQQSTPTNGVFKVGQLAEGYFKVVVSKSGFQDFETYVYLQHGEVVMLDVALYPNTSVNVAGTVTNLHDGQPVENASVWLLGNQTFALPPTDASGVFAFSNIPVGVYNLAASAPSMSHSELMGLVVISDTNLNLVLNRTYRKEGVRERSEVDGEIDLRVFENPFLTETTVEYPGFETEAEFLVINNQGQIVFQRAVSNSPAQVSIGKTWPTGIYYAMLKKKGSMVSVKKLVKSEN